MSNITKYHRFNNPTLTQGGWARTGEGNNYIERVIDTGDANYWTRISTIEYVIDVSTNKIKIFAYENIGLPMDVSVLALRNDNYILESLGWQENGGIFTISANYDKLGVMFRYQNGGTITPDNITGIRITNWFDLSLKRYENGAFVDTTNNPEKYSGGSWT